MAEVFDSEFENWEAEYDYIQRGDYKNLLIYRKKLAEEDGEDFEAQWKYADALILNKDYKKALEILTELYQKEPESIDVTHSILEALFNSGKTENDFKWIEKPDIMVLNKTTIDACIKLLKAKSMGIYDLLAELYGTGAYLKFSEDDLLEKIKSDDRFTISGHSNLVSDIKISLKKK